MKDLEDRSENLLIDRQRRAEEVLGGERIAERVLRSGRDFSIHLCSSIVHVTFSASDGDC